MAVDTPARRLSALQFPGVPSHGVPRPDGTIGQADRETLVGMYAGIVFVPLAEALTVRVDDRARAFVGDRARARVADHARAKRGA